MKKRLLMTALGAASVLITMLVAVALQAEPERAPQSLDQALEAKTSDDPDQDEFGDVIGIDFEVETSDDPDQDEFGDVIGIDFEVEASDEPDPFQLGGVLGIDFEVETSAGEATEIHVEWSEAPSGDTAAVPGMSTHP